MKRHSKRLLMLLPVSLLIAGCSSSVSAADAAGAVTTAYAKTMATTVDGLTLSQYVDGSVSAEYYDGTTSEASGGFHVQGREELELKAADLLGEHPQASLTGSLSGSYSFAEGETSLSDSLDVSAAAYYKDTYAYLDFSGMSSLLSEISEEAGIPSDVNELVTTKSKIEVGLLKDLLNLGDSSITVQGLLENVLSVQMPTEAELSPQAEEFFTNYKGFSAKSSGSTTTITLALTNAYITDYYVSEYTKSLESISGVSIDTSMLSSNFAELISSEMGTFDITAVLTISNELLTAVKLNVNLDQTIDEGQDKTGEALFTGTKISIDMEVGINIDITSTPSISFPSDLDSYVTVDLSDFLS